MKISETGIKVEGVVISLAAGKGKSSAISRSKSKNRMATRKKRNEKGNRADFSGVKATLVGGALFSVSGAFR